MAVVCMQKGFSTFCTNRFVGEAIRRQLSTANVVLAKEVFKRDKPHLNIGEYENGTIMPVVIH